MIGSLRVIGESSIAAGVRRIEAVTAEGAEQFVYAQQDLIRELRALMNHMPNLAQAMKKSIEENAEMKKQIEDYIREKSMRLKEEDRGESFGEQRYQGYAICRQGKCGRYEERGFPDQGGDNR